MTRNFRTTWFLNNAPAIMAGFPVSSSLHIVFSFRWSLCFLCNRWQSRLSLLHSCRFSTQCAISGIKSSWISWTLYANFQWRSALRVMMPLRWLSGKRSMEFPQFTSAESSKRLLVWFVFWMPQHTTKKCLCDVVRVDSNDDEDPCPGDSIPQSLRFVYQVDLRFLMHTSAW